MKKLKAITVVLLIFYTTFGAIILTQKCACETKEKPMIILDGGSLSEVVRRDQRDLTEVENLGKLSRVNVLSPSHSANATLNKADRDVVVASQAPLPQSVESPSNDASSGDSAFTLSGSGQCLLPKLRSFDTSITEFIKSESLPECTALTEKLPAFVELESGILRATEIGKQICQNITYKHLQFGFNGRSVLYSTVAFVKPEGNPVAGDLIEASCTVNPTSWWPNEVKKFITGHTTLAKDLKSFHYNIKEDQSLVRSSESAIRELTELRNEAQETPLNILFIGIDSTSHASFYRQLPKTIQYLSSSFNFMNDNDDSISFQRREFEQRHNLEKSKSSSKSETNIYEMNGYTIVGDGTTAQLTGLLTGSLENNLPDARAKVKNSGFVDSWPFVWKDLEKYGYSSLYAEDNPGIGAFTLRLKGWSNQPTDHFFGPFWLGHGRYHNSIRPNPRECKDNEPYFLSQLNWAREYLTKYDKMPKFAFTFTKTAHDNHNLLRIMDDYLPDYLESLRESGILNKTAVFLFGDHGSRYGPIRETKQGRLEERLPLNMIMLPDWWTKAHPKEANNLYQNQNRLTTPFDIYLSILHIADLPYQIDDGLGYVYPPVATRSYQNSIFAKIPETRTCGDAGVADHWCVCQVAEDLSSDDPTLVKGTSELVKTINDILEKDGEDRCEYPLSLQDIKYAVKLQSNKQLSTFSGTKDDLELSPMFDPNSLKSDSYKVQVQFSTFPKSTGVFEGTFEVVTINKTVSVIPEPHFSRVDEYGHQECDPKPHIRQFCKCKK